MATAIAQVTVIAVRLLTILNVDLGAGADLSDTDAVDFGDFTAPKASLPFLAIGLPSIETDIIENTTLTEWSCKSTWRIEGWIADSTDGKPVGRLATAASFANRVIGAIQDDHKSGGASSLQDYLTAVPRFNDFDFHGKSEHDGQAYAQFSVEVVLEYRTTAGI